MSGGGFLRETGFRVYVNDNSIVQKSRDRGKFNTGYSDHGIYITNAVKTPKSEYAVSKESIEDSLPYLEKELALFPNVKVIMLMGDVAKKAFNMICKKATKKNAVPSISTYKLRNTEIFYNGIRIMSSYIMTGRTF